LPNNRFAKALPQNPKHQSVKRLISYCEYFVHAAYSFLNYWRYYWLPAHFLKSHCLNVANLVLAKPLPTVTWFRNDVMVSNVSIALPSGGTTHVRSELRITGLGRRDVHSELTCQALNNPKTAPLASTLHVDMNCKYRHVEL
jgi:hypothetical protein